VFIESTLMTPLNDPVQIGDWLVDPRDDSITRGAERIKLEPRTMRLLMTLAQAPGEVVSQEQLLETVWSGVVVGPASVYQSVSQLRKVLGDSDDPPRYIATVARKGYRLLALVSPASLDRIRQVRGIPEAGTSPSEGQGVVPVDVASPPPPRRWRWIAVACLAVLVITAAVWRFGTNDEFAPISIAVLPFKDLTIDQSERPFCDGLTEETASWLAQVPTLRVVARTSTFSYRDRDADVRTIGRELATSHIISGSLRRSGDKLRITVQLIDTNTGFELWSESYDAEAGNELSVQERVARSVVGNLELRITADTERRFAERRTRSADAQALYLMAKSHAAKLDSQSNDQAILLFRKAIVADPDFALAKIWLARAIANRRYLETLPIEKLAPEIEPLLKEAAKQAPDLSDLYVVRGGFELQMRRRETALADLRRALELSPSSNDAAIALGYYYLTAAEPRDALIYYTLASGLDPRNFHSHAYRCMVLADMAQFEIAEDACDRARSLASDSAWVYSVSSQLEAARGRFEEAFKWNGMALERGADLAEINAERASWLVQLGMLSEAGHAYARSLAANPDATRRNVSIANAGTVAAFAAGGTQGLRGFVRANGLADSDDPLMMLELANAELLAEDVRQARVYVDRALASPALLPEDLSSPFAARVGFSYLPMVATVLRGTGDEAGARKQLDELAKVLDQLTAAGVDTYGLHALKAQLSALRGKSDEAMNSLRRAASLGWADAWLAERQPYFQSLRSRVDFRELLATVRARNAVTAARLAPRLSVLSRLFGRPGRAAA